MHTFDQDFYGEKLQVAVMGYIREERNYSSVGKILSHIKYCAF